MVRVDNGKGERDKGRGYESRTEEEERRKDGVMDRMERERRRWQG